MTRVLAALTVLFLNVNLYAQSEQEAVKATVNRMFEGMRKSDSSMIRSTFSDRGILQTIAKTKDGNTIIRSEPLDTFLVAVTKPHTEVYDERIEFGAIHIDSDLASVWTPYKFYVGDKFSHCGVNSFQLVKLAGEWKIQYIIDTRRRQPCD
jgi:hypothetical protein